ncbi:MAG: hypothetical protein IPH84_14135 [Bacteroidales bacterium]|nr:hypothetical protein [Bacteroidales bacterium]
MNAHSFHIPVMGIGFTIDTPVRVAHLGISSVISLVDDMLMEKMREFHCRQMNVPFQGISSKIEDFRAKRITAFLDLMDKSVKEKVEALKESVHRKGGEFEKYMEMLPASSEIKLKFQQFVKDHSQGSIRDWLNAHLPVGGIDVNIMTKLDRANYKNKEKLPAEFNDAHAALRGFANSTVQASLVLSAGMNPKLYSYLEEFEGFFPVKGEDFTKKIILKVSDYRSALIQGKFLAKKGLWVSEYRIESGLNCGGHAFATQGFLLGPILEEFKLNRAQLVNETFSIFEQALASKSRYCPENAPGIKITAQGGVGTAEEHQFLIDHYELNSIGWGTPFLLVPEVSNIDKETLQLLQNAKAEDLYLSNISPLGVPFNTVKGNSKDEEKLRQIHHGNPGSACSKQYASLNDEFTEKPICTASKQYQKLKIDELGHKELSFKDYIKEYKTITDKSCICVGLGTSALLANDLDTHVEGIGVSVCPGPNLAWFSEEATLKQMTDHIYGRDNLISDKDRPHVFINELKLYIDYLTGLLKELKGDPDKKQLDYYNGFRHNILAGISYYRSLQGIKGLVDKDDFSTFMKQLSEQETRLLSVKSPYLTDPVPN